MREEIESGWNGQFTLPRGRSVVSKPDTGLSQPKEFIDTDVPEKKKQKVWYVLLQRVTLPPPGELFGMTFEKSWRFAHTKKWARDQARAAELEGWKVIDIFPGTKTHISHKFRGL